MVLVPKSLVILINSLSKNFGFLVYGAPLEDTRKLMLDMW